MPAGATRDISMMMRVRFADGQSAEPAADRGELVVFGPAAGAAGQVARDGGSGVLVEGADYVGADLALPVSACMDHVSSFPGVSPGRQPCWPDHGGARPARRVRCGLLAVRRRWTFSLAGVFSIPVPDRRCCWARRVPGQSRQLRRRPWQPPAR